MPRYFLPLQDGAASVLDDEGIDLADEQAALRHADWCLREVVANSVLNGEPIRLASHISVMDQAGVEVGRIYVRDVLRFSDGELEATDETRPSAQRFG